MLAQAALATSASQYTCMGLLLWALWRKRLLQGRHLRSPPPFATVAPLLRARPGKKCTAAFLCMLQMWRNIRAENKRR